MRSLFALKPVTFRYKKQIDPTSTSQFGLVAEDVEKVDPALVVRDKEGKPYSVRYDQVNAMLLNEFLKEHPVKNEAARSRATSDNRRAKIWNDSRRSSGERAGVSNPKGERTARHSESVPSRTSTRANWPQDEFALADQRRNWSTILKAAPAPTKQQHSTISRHASPRGGSLRLLYARNLLHHGFAGRKRSKKNCAAVAGLRRAHRFRT